MQTSHAPAAVLRDDSYARMGIILAVTVRHIVYPGSRK